MMRDQYGYPADSMAPPLDADIGLYDDRDLCGDPGESEPWTDDELRRMREEYERTHPADPALVAAHLDTLRACDHGDPAVVRRYGPRPMSATADAHAAAVARRTRLAELEHPAE